ncbi:hypothetical protein BRYFOR_07919 [Marvinbryantia formatexigens DSM 14469]|uniref:POTRA domain protein, FtsQ-type n=1 Tax=Marvinbryantia formatexigens DSM 14469 TaxID=478749 RepID=C6LH09_9FIRM|nr:cell division protein FtsQ/DivIB [Marvinbryantia formatexigens]EET60068.1 hypothetical protein BRYFOR_07919 [Marvinbryantia formatexigens DSM 14469]UWO23861.1 cell division protein FtsQ/DivIB [Marvinbryantia formatexigens DSM 14469]SDG50873.1 Cell division septal protein FtsQ [Marvinbryantia formatexigens]
MELQRRKKRNLLKLPLLVFFAVVVIGFAVIFGLFHIRTVDVTGNQFYSAEEIQKMVMSDSLAENTIYLTWKYSDPAAAEELPFLSAVEISMIEPWHVQIRVYEKTIAGYLMFSGSRVYFDTDGNVVEISGEEREGVPPVSGISIGQPVVGEALPVADGGFLDDIVANARALHQSGLTPDEIHYDDQQELILYFGESRVLLGDTSYMEEKLEELSAIYPQMEGMSGTLHMENYTPDITSVRFVPGERGEEEQELIINLNRTSQEAETNEAGEPVQNEDGTPQTDTSETSETTAEEGGSGYVEDSSRFSTDANGNEIYTDEAGNTTTNLDQPYLGDDGQIITDGYGYIDPYTGAYILN